jgi:hypothetical protein
MSLKVVKISFYDSYFFVTGGLNQFIFTDLIYFHDEMASKKALCSMQET